MTDLLKGDTLYLFLFLIVPGLVAMETYDLLVAGPRRQFGKYAVELLAIGLCNFVIVSPLFGFVLNPTSPTCHRWTWNAGLVAAVVLAPIAEAAVFSAFRKWDRLRGVLIQPTLTPWDFFFSKAETCWVRLVLKSGKVLAGYFGDQSYATSFPEPPQIYLERVWKFQNGGFSMQVENSNGAIVSLSECQYVEFFKGEPAKGSRRNKLVIAHINAAAAI